MRSRFWSKNAPLHPDPLSLERKHAPGGCGNCKSTKQIVERSNYNSMMEVVEPLEGLISQMIPPST